MPALAENIRDNGWNVTKTLLVMATETPGKYVIIDGVHRWCAVRYNFFFNVILIFISYETTVQN